MITARCRKLAVLMVALAASSGCEQPARRGNEAGQGEPEMAHRRRHGTSEPYVVNLGRPAAPFYQTRPDRAEISTLGGEIESRLPALKVDPCLERAAAAYARGCREAGEQLPLAFLEFVLHWAGCPDPSAAMTSLLTDQDGVQAAVEVIEDTADNERFTHVGANRIPAEHPYRWEWVALLVSRKMSVKPVPTSGEPGAVIPLQFHVDPSFHSADLYVTQPRGEVKKFKAGMSSGWTVASLPLADEVGCQWVELLAEGQRGPEVLALFPIEVGRQPSQIWVGTSPPSKSTIASPADAEAFMINLINTDRRRFGLPELTHDPALSAIARSHSAEMASGEWVAHVSPTSGDIGDRLRTGGYRVRLAYENIARAATLDEAEEGLLRSPGHRGALLSPEVHRFGVGVVWSGTPRAYYITQIFVDPLLRAAAPALAADLEEALKRYRSSKNLMTPQADARLSRIASSVANGLAAGMITEESYATAISSDLDDQGIEGARWTTFSGTAYGIEDISFDHTVEELRLAGVGYGVAPSASPDAPSTFVVLMVMP
jgi:uncharacterized protein YkwD